MAALCVELRMTPAEYWKLKLDEHAALIEELRLRHKQAKAAQGG